MISLTTNHTINKLKFNLSAGVYLSLNDVIIPNHGYVMFSDIGTVSGDTALICHTNRPTTTPATDNDNGDFYAPDGTRLQFSSGPVRRSRGDMIVRLYRFPSEGDPDEGIYHCEIEDDTDTLQKVYVGLYTSGGGMTSTNNNIE